MKYSNKVSSGNSFRIENIEQDAFRIVFKTKPTKEDMDEAEIQLQEIIGEPLNITSHRTFKGEKEALEKWRRETS